jgi:hypothetical protein
MGAFNEWARGSYLDGPAERHVVPVALNLLVGAAALTRLHVLKLQGFQPDPLLAAPHVLAMAELEACLA